MTKVESKNKQNPKLQQSELKYGRASFYLEYYLGRSETPVLNDNGEQVPAFRVAEDERKRYKQHSHHTA